MLNDNPHSSIGIFIPAVKEYLPKGSLVLEGGCGRGNLVHALNYHGYQAIGIDFAERTVKKINEAAPELDIRIGDVRNLPIEDDKLDGYISGGVIEHFWDGYDEILSEMARTIKNGGYLFITFPSMSPLRKLKTRFNLYPEANKQDLENQQKKFYQFALSENKVINELQENGFTLLKKKKVDGIKGFKDEVSLFKPILQIIYDGKTFYPLRQILDSVFKQFAFHMSFLIMKKN